MKFIKTKQWKVFRKKNFLSLITTKKNYIYLLEHSTGTMFYFIFFYFYLKKNSIWHLTNNFSHFFFCSPDILIWPSLYSRNKIHRTARIEKQKKKQNLFHKIIGEKARCFVFCFFWLDLFLLFTCSIPRITVIYFYFLVDIFWYGVKKQHRNTTIFHFFSTKKNCENSSFFNLGYFSILYFAK